MTRPLISCIVPVYNGQRFLKEALDSIFAQTYRPLEVIVVDDGSTDGTANVVAEYPQPIEYIHQANQGCPRARNRGIQAAKGDFITFLDSDDLWRSDKLSRQMDAFEAQPELAFCVTHIKNFWMPEVANQEATFRHHPKAQAVPGYISSTLLAKRSAFETVGLYSSQLKHGDSLDWFVRAREKGAAGELIADVLVDRRIHTANTSRISEQQSRKEFLLLLKKFLDKQRSGKSDTSKP